MKQFETDLSAQLRALANEADPTGLSRVGHRSQAGFARARRPWVPLLAGAAAVGIAVATFNAVGLLGSHTDGDNQLPSASESDDGQELQFDAKPGEPCPAAREHSLTDLASFAEAPMWMPDAPIASRERLTGAWTCAGGNTPVLTFGPVKVSFESGWANPNPRPYYEKLIETFGAGQIDQALGLPALVIPPSSEGTLGGVMVIVGDTLIRVVGDGTVPADQLLSIVQSIDLSRPLGPAVPLPTEVDR